MKLLGSYIAIKNTKALSLLRAVGCTYLLRRSLITACALLVSLHTFAQDKATINARIDAKQIVVGDRAHLFIDVQVNGAQNKLQWAAIPDSFNNLEIEERSKIDTTKNGDMVTYHQKLDISGFDSGVFQIPPFVFQVTPNGGTPYTVQSDSFTLLVQTVAVDTTKGFKGIKGIIYVRSTWLDYIWLIIGTLVFLALVAAVIWYFIRHKKETPAKPKAVESLQDYALRLLSELDAKQLWQKKQVKEYYVELTDIVRNYIEHRFHTPAMELTTDELLGKAMMLPDLQPYHDLLSQILHTADLAKFAKFQPLPQEHTDAMARAKEFVDKSRPVVVAEPINDNPTTEKTT